MRRAIVPLLLVLAVLGIFGVATTSAQTSNLLQQAGFEDGYSGRTIPQGGDVAPGSINVPSAWGFWVTQQPHTESWMNLVPTVFPHNGPNPDPHGGSRALNLTRDGGTFTAAVFQQVSVSAGTNVRGAAWAFIKTCKPNPTDCSSEPSSGSRVRVGIDPTGGTDPTSPSIVWSGFATPHNTWQQVTVDATATGGTVTIFLYATQTFPASGGGLTFNRVYWDDAELIVGGEGAVVPGATAVPPTPTPPPVVAFVVPQQPQPDGSIVHVVQDGDTVASIAFAYGVSVEEIIALNPGIGSGRFIFPGQELLIKPAPEVVPTTAPVEPEVPIEVTTEPNLATQAPPPANLPELTPAPIQQPTVIPLGPAFGGNNQGSAPNQDTGQASANDEEGQQVAALPTTEPPPTAPDSPQSAARGAVVNATGQETVNLAGQGGLLQPPPGQGQAETQSEPPEQSAAPTKAPAPTKEAVEVAAAPEEQRPLPSDEQQNPIEAEAEAEAQQPAAEQSAEQQSVVQAPDEQAPAQQSAPEQPAVIRASVCVAMFDDLNQNGLREEGEALLAGGTVEVITPNNVIVGSHTTDGVSEPFCINDLDMGEYIAVASAPEGYSLTMAQQVRLAPSENTQIAFGASQSAPQSAPQNVASSSQADAAAQQTSAPDNSQLPQIALLIVGGLAGVVIVAGMLHTILLRRRAR